MVYWSGVEVVGAVLGLSAAEQDEVWARWRRGESLRLIARRLGKRGPSVRAFVLQTGAAASGRHRHRAGRAWDRVRSLQEAIDTTTPGGKLVFHVFAALAEFERDLIRERTAAGLVAARARGGYGGRPSVMTTHKLQVAQEMYRSGQYTVSAIATTLGVSRLDLSPSHPR